MKEAAALLLVLAAFQCNAASVPILRVCADPNNLPFSNRAGEGFENEIAELIAKDLGMTLQYVWWAQRRGYVRQTIDDAKCDLWPGVASGLKRIATTRPYYRSTYVFVTREDRPLSGLTLDDDRLRSLSIGVQMVGNDAMNTPPAHAIAERGLINNVHGFMLFGDYRSPNPPAQIIEAVAKGKIDVALAWGPLAGYFGSRSAIPLRIEPIAASFDAVRWPMSYDISMGVNRDSMELLDRINSILLRERTRIDNVLARFNFARSAKPENMNHLKM